MSGCESSTTNTLRGFFILFLLLLLLVPVFQSFKLVFCKLHHAAATVKCTGMARRGAPFSDYAGVIPVYYFSTLGGCTESFPSLVCRVWVMQVSESIQCPFCGQTFELVIDTSVDSQRFTTDCEVCCRPFEVTVECEPGEILSLDVQGN